MKFMIPLLMAVLPAVLVAQSQSGSASGVPSIAIPKTSAVLVIETPKYQAVSVPIGFISGKAEHVEIARQVFEGLTSGKSPVYHAGDHDADLDLSDELTALRANFEMLPPSQ